MDRSAMSWALSAVVDVVIGELSVSVFVERRAILSELFES